MVKCLKIRHLLIEIINIFFRNYIKHILNTQKLFTGNEDEMRK